MAAANCHKSSDLIDETKIEEIFRHLESGCAPGVSVGVALGGRPIFRRGFGLANAELPVALSPTMRMPIGSVTKQFTCLALMLLAEDGSVDIDAGIGKYLPGLHAVSQAQTPRQIMGQISGVRDTYELAMLVGAGNETSAASILSLYEHISDVNSRPTYNWAYNNGAYVILAAIIEAVAAKPFEDVLRERIFEPVGMRHTIVRRFDNLFVSNCACTHVSKPGGVFTKGLRRIEGLGQGGIYSTVDDMLLWLAHMRAPIIGSDATWRLMRTPMRLQSGAETHYGLGLEIGRYRDVEIVFHAGGVIGGNAFILTAPKAEIDVVVLVNRSDVSGARLVQGVLDVCLPHSQRGTNGLLRPPIVGLYRSPQTGRVIQFFLRGGEQIVSIDGTDMPFAYTSDRVLTPVGSFVRESVEVVGDRSKPGQIRFISYGVTDDLVLEPETRSEASLATIEGAYLADVCGVEAAISGGSLKLSSRRPVSSATYRLQPLSRGIWRAQMEDVLPLSAILSFSADSRRFRLTTPRLHALEFVRAG